MAIDPSLGSEFAEPRRNVRVRATSGDAGQPFSDKADRRVSRMVAVARLLDNAFEIPGLGVRVGWDAILGLATGVGDVAGALAALYIVHEARKLGAPRKVLAMMVANIALDAAIGAIPALGDVFDAAFKANQRNLRMIGVTMGKDGHTWDRPEWVRSEE